MIEKYKNASETKLLSLMANQDKFLQYIIHEHNNSSNCYTILRPLIWAIHFNIPKYQRLQLLENILHENMKYMKICYSYLPEKQILGKTYEVLGIPTVFGEPDKSFLNNYKKFKSYYPVKYPKNKKIPVDSQHESIQIHTILDYSYRYSENPLINQEIINSTPNTKKIPRFKMYPLLSPIRTSIKNECNILSTSSVYKKNCVLNKQNRTENDNQQISSIKLELSNFNILNAKQTNDQNNLIHEQNQIHVISSDHSDHKYDHTENDISQLNMSTDENTPINISKLNDITWNESSFSNEKEYIQQSIQSDSKASIYSDNSKETDYTNASIPNQKNNSLVLKEFLSEKLDKNLKIPIPSTSTNIKRSKLENITHETNQSYSEMSTSESWTRIKQTSSDILFSDLDKSAQSSIKMKKLHSINNEIEQDLINLEFNDTWEKNLNDWSMDIESQGYNNEESIFGVNSSTQMSNLSYRESNNEPNISYTSHMSSIIFRNNSIDFISNSSQLDSIIHDISISKWSQDSSDANNDEEINIKTHKNFNALIKINNMEFEEISYSISE